MTFVAHATDTLRWAITKVSKDPRTRAVFTHFREPWFFLEAAEGSENYMETFKQIVKDAFVQQADSHGEVELVFNRIFLVAIEE